MSRSLTSIAVAVVLAACSATTTPPPAASPFVTDPAPRSIPYDPTTKPTFRDADRAIFGRIVEVGKSPGFWSGIVATYQSVTFEVLQRLDGLDLPAPHGWPQAGDRCTIWFGVIGPPDCDRRSPELDPRIYRVGAVGVVAANFGGPVHGDESLRHTIALHARTSFHEMDEARMQRELLFETQTGPRAPSPR